MGTVLEFTTLGKNAFQPKPKKNDLLTDCHSFWEKEYQTQELSGQLGHLFKLLLNTIENLEIESEQKQQLNSIIEELRKACQTDFFKPFIEEIKKQLETVTYYLSSSIPLEEKQGPILQLHEVNVCPEGTLFKLQQIIYLLYPQDTFSWLANIRLEIIQRFFYTRAVKSVHTLKSILNYAQKIGLNMLDGDYSTQMLANDRFCFPLCQRGKQEFNEFFFKYYDVEPIVESITQRLQTEINTRLREFQQEFPSLGLVISAEIPSYTIEKKLIGLPIQQLHKLIQPISEDDDNYFVIKPKYELKREVAQYLTKVSVLKKQTKKFIFNNTNWKFTIIEGDDLGNYGFITQKTKPFPKKILPLTVFEEEKLYTHFSLESFNKSKRFLRLGINSFYYFYKKNCDFTHCYLTDIDFTKFEANFLTSVNGLKDAFFIRPKLIYEQLVCFYALKKHKNLYDTYIVDIQHSKEFIEIITLILETNPGDLESFFDRHKGLILKKELQSAILNDLTERKTILQQQLNETIHNLASNKNYISHKAISIYMGIAAIIMIAGFIYLPLILLGFGLLVIGMMLSYIAQIIDERIKVKQTILQKQVTKLEKEQQTFSDLENKLNEARNESLFFKITNGKTENKVKIPSEEAFNSTNILESVDRGFTNHA